MTGRPKNPPWTFRVGEKANVFNEFSIPHHQIGELQLKAYLQAVVSVLKSSNFEDLARFFVSKRAGPVSRRDLEVRWFHHPERSVCGYFCGDWEHYAEASYPISTSENAALISIRDANSRNEEPAPLYAGDR